MVHRTSPGGSIHGANRDYGTSRPEGQSARRGCPMVEVAQLTRPKIRRQVGDASLDKAKSYLRDDVWSDLRTQGATIKGRCRGQTPQPYRVVVTFDGDAIATAECSCPVGDGGHCKHVAALLL